MCVCVCLCCEDTVKGTGCVCVFVCMYVCVFVL